MVKKKNNVEQKTKKEKVCETFEIEKDGETKIVESCGIEEEKIAAEGQIKKQNKIFKEIVFVMLGFIAIFGFIIFLNYKINSFEIEGVKFEIDKGAIQGVTLYKTSIPVVSSTGKKTDYNFWLRTDPRTLQTKVPMEDGKDMDFKKNIVMDLTTRDLYCEGDWGLGYQNFQTLYTLLQTNITARNSSVDYDLEKNMFITINKGNKTEIAEIEMGSYELNIANCEVVPAFERLMIEALIQYEQGKLKWV